MSGCYRLNGDGDGLGGRRTRGGEGEEGRHEAVVGDHGQGHEFAPNEGAVVDHGEGEAGELQGDHGHPVEHVVQHVHHGGEESALPDDHGRNLGASEGDLRVAPRCRHIIEGA